MVGSVTGGGICSWWRNRFTGSSTSTNNGGWDDDGMSAGKSSWIMFSRLKRG